jgi:hypothetical protein
MRDAREHWTSRRWGERTSLVGRAARLLQVLGVALISLSILGGCGANGPASGNGTEPSQTITLGESGPGGAGDENPIATQIVYDLSGTRALPQSLSAPAFLRIALTLRSADDRQHVVRLALPKPVKMTVPPGGAATRILDGQHKGSYAISVDSAEPSARLVVG